VCLTLQSVFVFLDVGVSISVCVTLNLCAGCLKPFLRWVLSVDVEMFYLIPAATNMKRILPGTLG